MYNKFKNRLQMGLQQQTPGLEEFVYANVLNLIKTGLSHRVNTCTPNGRH